MEYRILAGTDIKVSAITYGAFAIGGWFWGGSDEKDAVKAIDAAIDNGVTTIDTAPVYGMGHSESILGKTIKKKRDKVQILTKFGMIWNQKKGDFAFHTKFNDGTDVDIYKYCGKDSIIYECEQSLKRLQTDYIDLYQMHWPESVTPIDETMEALERLIEQGKIRAGGVCNFNTSQLKGALKNLHLSSNQVPYNMINRDIEADLIPFCIENSVSVLTHTSLQKGLLTGKINLDHKFNDGDHRPTNIYFKKENHIHVMNFLESIKKIADERGITLAQLAINWLIDRPSVASVLVGARNVEQVEDNVKAASFKLTAEELEEIDTFFKKIKLTH